MKSKKRIKNRPKEVTSKIMSTIRSTNTTPERMLGTALWKAGLRYRKHYKKIRGKPDFVLVRYMTAIFCDGDFWHGNNWKIRGLKSLNDELKNYSKFWKSKILKNIERDKRVNNELTRLGWRVIRIWESDIRKSPNQCALMVWKKLKRMELRKQL